MTPERRARESDGATKVRGSEHPFFMVTGKDGKFELKNLPSGQHTITAWHEKLGTMEQKVAVGPNEAKTVEFVFKVRRSYNTASMQ